MIFAFEIDAIRTRAKLNLRFLSIGKDRLNVIYIYTGKFGLPFIARIKYLKLLHFTNASYLLGARVWQHSCRARFSLLFTGSVIPDIFSKLLLSMLPIYWFWENGLCLYALTTNDIAMSVLSTTCISRHSIIYKADCDWYHSRKIEEGSPLKSCYLITFHSQFI